VVLANYFQIASFEKMHLWMKLELQKLARSIYSTCVTNSISIDIQWIPRSENEKDDYISRLIDQEDWEVIAFISRQVEL
jgi:CHAT domain-containing protein